MKIKQERVNKRTEEFDESVPEAERDTAEAKDGAAELARKQKKVEELLREMATRYHKEQAGN